MNNNDLNKKFIISDCLSDGLREKLLVDCKPFLGNCGNEYPAYQSRATLRNYPQFQLVHQIFDSLACQYLEEKLLLTEQKYYRKSFLINAMTGIEFKHIYI